jgi:hypothetical protein
MSECPEKEVRARLPEKEADERQGYDQRGCRRGRPVTETDWLAATDPDPLLEFLGGAATARKLRLFACACCRRIWDRLADERSRLAVSVAERYADRMATGEELIEAADNVHHEVPSDEWAACYAINPSWDSGYGPGGQTATHPYAYWTAIHCANEASGNIAGGNPPRPVEGVVAEQAHQACLLRDIFGNPFLPITFPPSWRTPTVIALAQQMYESRDFSAMPVLADALQEAGYDNEDILNHCRQPGTHVRGCWVVDLVLNKG